MNNQPRRLTHRDVLLRCSCAQVELLEHRQLLSAGGVWSYAGSQNDEAIIVRAHPNNAGKIQLMINGAVVQTRLAKGVRSMHIDGRGGDDRIRVDLGPDFKRVNMKIEGGQGNDTLEGGCGDDELDGGRDNDLVQGDMGDDRVLGGTGDDALTGNEGKDMVWGGLGRDSLSGGMGEDDMHGGHDADQLAGGYGGDVVRGGRGKDIVRGGEGTDTLFGGNGRDTVYRHTGDVLRNVVKDRAYQDVTGNPLSSIEDPAALKAWIIESALKRWSGMFGKPAYGWPGPEVIYSRGMVFTDGQALSANMAAEDAAPPTSSNTNTQEENVDEADLVETDGEHLFVVSGGELIIIDAWPADQAKEVARVPLTGTVSGIYLREGRLTVVSRSSPNWWAWNGATMRIAPGGPRSKPQVHVMVIDVGAAAEPKMLETTTLDGSLSASRMIGSQLYLVMDSALKAPDPVQVDAPDPKGSYTKVYESEASYRARLEGMSLAQLLPGYTTTAAGEASAGGALVGDEILAPKSNVNLSSMFSVIRMDVSDDERGLDDTTTVAGFSGEVYASETSLYVASQGYDGLMGDVFESRTDLYKFALGQDVKFEGTGHVPGHLINRYAMSEHAGHLRLATTTTSGGFSNNIFVMKDKGETLETVGKVEGLALSERIYAARFVGDRGYLVTFRQVDPLFTLDLSKPTHPKVAGELKIPGYSTYLHPIAAGSVLGFGREVTELGRIGALQLSVFDVLDINNPQRKALYQIAPSQSGGYVSSLAEHDPHAFAWFADRQIAAIPVAQGWNRNYLELIDLSDSDTPRLIQRIEHTGRVLRAVNIGDYIYSVGTDAVKVIRIGKNGPVAEIPLNGESPDWGIIRMPIF